MNGELKHAHTLVASTHVKIIVSAKKTRLNQAKTGIASPNFMFVSAIMAHAGFSSRPGLMVVLFCFNLYLDLSQSV